MITDTQLKHIMPNLSAQKLQALPPAPNAAMQTYGIDNMLRTAPFVAQLAHESAELRFIEEIWGPTDTQRRYEPPSDLAKRLGNNEPGDGKRFKGRGPIQITGRLNDKNFGDLLGVDLVNQPERSVEPEVALSKAAIFSRTIGLNDLPDAEQCVTFTKRINGGNGNRALAPLPRKKRRQGRFRFDAACVRGRRTRHRSKRDSGFRLQRPGMLETLRGEYHGKQMGFKSIATPCPHGHRPTCPHA